MTPEQKIKWAILKQVSDWGGQPAPIYPCSDVDELYEALEEEGCLQDAKYTIREGEVETGLACEFSRNYESKAVAIEMPDGSWVGWTYWYGGGKHAEPEAIDWMGSAYDVDCHEEEKMVVVRTFSLPVAP